jgi:hypothetical protein
VVMFVAGAVLSAAELWRSRGKPDTIFLLLALVACAWSLVRSRATSPEP